MGRPAKNTEHIKKGSYVCNARGPLAKHITKDYSVITNGLENGRFCIGVDFALTFVHNETGHERRLTNLRKFLAVDELPTAKSLRLLENAYEYMHIKYQRARPVWDVDIKKGADEYQTEELIDRALTEIVHQCSKLLKIEVDRNFLRVRRSKHQELKKSFHVILADGSVWDGLKSWKGFMYAFVSDIKDPVFRKLWETTGEGFDVAICTPNRSMRLPHCCKFEEGKRKRRLLPVGDFPLSDFFVNQYTGVKRVWTYKGDLTRTRVRGPKCTRPRELNPAMVYKQPDWWRHEGVISPDCDDCDKLLFSLFPDQHCPVALLVKNYYKNAGGRFEKWVEWLETGYCITCSQKEKSFCGCGRVQEQVYRWGHRQWEKTLDRPASNALVLLREMAKETGRMVEICKDAPVKDYTPKKCLKELLEECYGPPKAEEVATHRWASDMFDNKKIARYVRNILRSMTGTGKSTLFRQLIESGEYESVLYCVASKGLTYSVYDELEEHDFFLYLNSNRSLAHCPRLVITVNSLHRILDEETGEVREFDLVIFDELETICEQLYSECTHRFVGSASVMRKLIDTAGAVWALDAHANKAGASMFPQDTRFWYNTWVPNRHMNIYCGISEKFIATIRDLVKNREAFCGPVSSVNMANWLVSKFCEPAGLKCLVTTAEVMKANKKAYSDKQIVQTLKDVDVWFYTSCVSVGISANYKSQFTTIVGCVDATLTNGRMVLQSIARMRKMKDGRDQLVHIALCKGKKLITPQTIVDPAKPVAYRRTRYGIHKRREFAQKILYGMDAAEASELTIPVMQLRDSFTWHKYQQKVWSIYPVQSLIYWAQVSGFTTQIVGKDKRIKPVTDSHLPQYGDVEVDEEQKFSINTAELAVYLKTKLHKYFSHVPETYWSENSSLAFHNLIKNPMHVMLRAVQLAHGTNLKQEFADSFIEQHHMEITHRQKSLVKALAALWVENAMGMSLVRTSSMSVQDTNRFMKVFEDVLPALQFAGWGFHKTPMKAARAFLKLVTGRKWTLVKHKISITQGTKKADWQNVIDQLPRQLRSQLPAATSEWKAYVKTVKALWAKVEHQGRLMTQEPVYGPFRWESTTPLQYEQGWEKYPKIPKAACFLERGIFLNSQRGAPPQELLQSAFMREFFCCKK